MKNIKKDIKQTENKSDINHEEVIALTKRDFFNSLLVTSLLLNFVGFMTFVAMSAKGLV